MCRWTWLILVVVLASGAVTGWYAYEFQTRTGELRVWQFALSCLPTCLFLAASIVGRRHWAIQLGIGVAAAAVGLLRVGLLADDLSRQPSGGFISFAGLESLVGWLVGMALALVALVVAITIAAVALARSSRERRETARSPRRSDQQ